MTPKPQVYHHVWRILFAMQCIGLQIRLTYHLNIGVLLCQCLNLLLISLTICLWCPLHKYQNAIQSSVVGDPTEMSGTPMNQNSQKELRDPLRVKCKGQPKIGKRLKCVEIGVSSQGKYFTKKLGIISIKLCELEEDGKV